MSTWSLCGGGDAFGGQIIFPSLESARPPSLTFQCGYVPAQTRAPAKQAPWEATWWGRALRVTAWARPSAWSFPPVVHGPRSSLALYPPAVCYHQKEKTGLVENRTLG